MKILSKKCFRCHSLNSAKLIDLKYLGHNEYRSVHECREGHQFVTNSIGHVAEWIRKRFGAF